MDIGILGFLWCEGTKKQKAKFLWNLIRADPVEDPNDSVVIAANKAKMRAMSPKLNRNPNKADATEYTSWSNPNVRYSFNRLFEFAIDFPRSQKDNTNEHEILDLEIILKQKPKFKE